VPIYSWPDGRLISERLDIICTRCSARRWLRICSAKHFGEYLIDLLRLPLIDQAFIDRHVTVTGWEHVTEARARYGGMLSVTAHLGHWEMAGVVTAQLLDRVAAIALDHDSARVTAFFHALRTSKRVTTIPVGAAVHRAQQLLGEGYLVAILGDYDYTAHGVSCEMFGRPIQAPRGPALLSLRCHTPIVPGFLVATGRGAYHLMFEPPIVPDATGPLEQRLRNITQQYVAVIETYVRRYPTQWFMFRPYDTPGIVRV
jgi:Kdo2-lipid IVA lauroyltransferase/acyltransferase